MAVIRRKEVQQAIPLSIPRNRHANAAQRVKGSSANGTTLVNAYRFYKATFKGT